jgi:hypothetical protein
MQHEPERAELGDDEGLAVEPQALGDTKRGSVTPPGAEAWEAGAAGEERFKGFVEVADCLLERLGVHLAEPGRFGLAFQHCQFRAQLRNAQALTRGGVVLLAASERPIENIAPRSGILPEQALLRDGWQRPVTVGFLVSCHAFTHLFG